MNQSVTASEIIEKEGKVPFYPDWDVYDDVSKAARLAEIKMISSSYAVRPECFVFFDKIEKADPRFGGECIAYSFDADEGLAFGQFEWTAEVKFKRKSCLKIKTIFLLLYVGLKGKDPKHIEYFFLKVGRFATYPYFRSHFSHNTSQSGLTMPPLPTLRERVD